MAENNKRNDSDEVSSALTLGLSQLQPTSTTLFGRFKFVSVYNYHHLNTLFFTEVYLGFSFCLSLLETVCSCVCCSTKKSPPTRCTSIANVVCRDFNEFGNKTVSLDHTLQQYYLNY